MVADEKSRERQRRYRESHREQIRESSREYTRAYYSANRQEILRKKREKDPPPYTDEMREYQRRYHTENRESLYQKSKRKVARDALLWLLWSEQGGLCYLCEKPLEFDRAVLEHDHGCCPGGQFCRYCARGAAHQRCNSVVGLCGDDPEELELIARKLRARSEALSQLREIRPEQAVLFNGEGA